MKGIQWNTNGNDSSFGTVSTKEAAMVAKDKEKEENQVKNQTIYAGNLKLVNQNPVAAKKENAQKEALKKLVDQLMNDLKTDEEIAECEVRKDQLTQEIKTYQEQVNSLDEGKERLKSAYGIEDDSEEQKNLNLLEKSRTDMDKLTSEEWEQLSNMGPLTDYQKEALRYDAMKEVWHNRISNAESRRKGESQTIVGIELNLLKSHPMVDAQKEAAAIMEEAKQTMLGMLREEGKDKVNEKIEENEEIQKKKAEEKKEEEKRKSEKNDAKMVQMDFREQVSDLQNVVSDHDKVQMEVRNLLDKEKLVDDDLKGLSIDEWL